MQKISTLLLGYNYSDVNNLTLENLGNLHAHLMEFRRLITPSDVTNIFDSYSLIELI